MKQTWILFPNQLAIGLYCRTKLKCVSAGKMKIKILMYSGILKGHKFIGLRKKFDTVESRYTVPQNTAESVILQVLLYPPLFKKN